MKKIHLLLSLSIFAFISTSFAQDCTLKKESGNTKVYTCRTTNEKFKSLKAEVIFENTTLEELREVLFDVSRYTKWQYKMTEAKMLQRVNNNEIIIRSVVDSPWPVENREMLVRFSCVLDLPNNFMTITARGGIDYDYPKDGDLVRVPFSEAHWAVTQKGSNLHISYTLQVDPGGSLPAWMVNMAMAEGPFETFKNLSDLLKSTE